jgi:hypothetical protein
MKSLYATGALALLLVAIGACGSGDSSDPKLVASHGGGAGTSGGAAADPNQTASGEGNTFNHPGALMGGQNGTTDIALRHREEQQIGGPDEVARLHGAQKISYAALGRMLTDFGVDLSGSDPLSAAQLYNDGKNALGAPIYGSRTPEMWTPSTSALAKEYDIFFAAAPDIIANIGGSKRCPGVVLLQNDQLTEDGISCLLGKPATPAHLTLANKLIAESGDPTKGAQIAVATLLAAAHISE